MPNDFGIKLEGYLGGDPVFEKTPKGKDCCKFSMAVTKKGAKDTQDKDKTQWFSITVYGWCVTQCHNLKKGSPVRVESGDDPTCLRGYKSKNINEETGEPYIGLSLSVFKVLPILWTKKADMGAPVESEPSADDGYPF